MAQGHTVGPPSRGARGPDCVPRRTPRALVVVERSRASGTMSAIRVTAVRSPDDEAAFLAVRRPDGSGSPGQVPANMERMVAFVGDDPMARGSCSTAGDLTGAPGLSGMIGHYEALDGDAGTALLSHAVRDLAGRGAVRVLGPMNGSTWASYRLALAALPDDERGDEPFFLGEPRNPFEYPGHFDRAGFQVCANYESRSVMLASQDTTEPDLPAAIEALGVSVESLDPSRFAESLREVYELSLHSFGDNTYYAPIGVEEFVASYVPLQPLLDPRLVLLARDSDGALVSLLFAYPDPLWRPDGRPVRAVVKTIAT